MSVFPFIGIRVRKKKDILPTPEKTNNPEIHLGALASFLPQKKEQVTSDSENSDYIYSTVIIRCSDIKEIIYNEKEHEAAITTLEGNMLTFDESEYFVLVKKLTRHKIII